MKTLNLLILCGLLTFAIQGNGQKIKNNMSYFNSPSKVGIFVQTYILYHNVSGGSASTEKAARKYGEAVNILKPQINPLEKLIEVYKDLYTQKGKSVVVIEENLDSLDLKEFVPPKTDKKYYKKDLRFLKEKFQIDEILIVSVGYGVQSARAYGVESGRQGMCLVQTEIINLNDNSFVIREETIEGEKINGDWDTPPAYDNLKISIQSAIEKAITKEKEKYRL